MICLSNGMTFFYKIQGQPSKISGKIDRSYCREVTVTSTHENSDKFNFEKDVFLYLFKSYDKSIISFDSSLITSLLI